MKERCETCRWWRKLPTAIHGGDWRVCHAAATVNVIEGETSLNAFKGRAVVVVTDFDVANLRTHKDFGCIRWESADDGS